MIKKIVCRNQMELFESAPVSFSQAEAAKMLGLSVRVLQHWEDSGIFKRECGKNGKSGRYSKIDMLELDFLKGLIYDCGFSIAALKDKLANLESPYCYDYREVVWDPRTEGWMSHADIACRELNRVKTELVPYAKRIFSEHSSGTDEELAQAVVSALRALIRGEKPKFPRKKKSNLQQL